MADSLSPTLVARLRERAQDPALRTDTGAIRAGSVDFRSALQDAITPPQGRSPEFQRELEDYLGGINSPLAGLMGTLAQPDGGQGRDLVDALGSLLGGQTLAMGDRTIATGPPPIAEPRPPATEAQVAAAESALGFPLPGALRQLYLEVADGGVGPGDGLHSLDHLVTRYAEITSEPAGPQGQPWPPELIPVSGEEWELVAIDRETGRLVLWDLEELDADDELPADQPTWAASFVPEAESLEAWLAGWAG